MTGAVHPSRDGGFTLIELLIAILILGIILPAIGATFYIGLRTTDDTNKRIIDSSDVQGAAAFVSVDVENASSFVTNDNSTCVAAGYSVNQPVLRLSWSDESTTPATPHDVNYFVDGAQLIRSSCVGVGGSATAIVVVHYLDPSALPAAWCPPSGDCSGNPSRIAIRGETITGQLFSLSGTRRVT
jgi:prepilin-type N-terminal cleavage/methylation domain-containing protein